jgi:hypothetical protein
VPHTASAELSVAYAPNLAFRMNGHQENDLRRTSGLTEIPPSGRDALTSHRANGAPRSTVMLSNDHRSVRPSAARESNRTCIITMVHGTYGRGFFPKEYRAGTRSWLGKLSPPPWFHEGSVFRNRLESELRKENITATFRIFRWSGANSVFRRARAADELNHLLASDPDNANSIVIGHSHGGNVAFRAISKLGSRGARINLITLATPFLRVFPTWSGPSFWQVYITLFFTLTLGVSSLKGAHLFSGQLWPEDLGVGNWAAMVVFPLAVATALLVRLIINPSPPAAKRQLDQAKTWASRPFTIAEEANYDSAGPHAPNLLVIRGVDDEAALALAFAAIATRINRAAMGATWKLLLCFMFLLAWVVDTLGPWILKGLGRIDFNSPSALPELHDNISRLFGWALLAAAASALMLVAIPALFRTWFGREFLIGAARCEVATDSVPDSIPSRIITLETPYYRPFPWVQAEQARSSTSTMHHEIYNYPGCVLEIVKWVNEHFDSRPQVR